MQPNAFKCVNGWFSNLKRTIKTKLSNTYVGPFYINICIIHLNFISSPWAKAQYPSYKIIKVKSSFTLLSTNVVHMVITKLVKVFLAVI